MTLGGGQAEQPGQILKQGAGLGAIVLGQGLHEQQVEPFQGAAELDGAVALGRLGELGLGAGGVGVKLTGRDLPAVAGGVLLDAVTPDALEQQS